MPIFVFFLQIWHLNLILWVFKGEFGVEMEPDSILQNGRSFSASEVPNTGHLCWMASNPMDDVTRIRFGANEQRDADY